MKKPPMNMKKAMAMFEGTTMDKKADKIGAKKLMEKGKKPAKPSKMSKKGKK